MDLRDTLLGLLDQKPSSGYDLKRIIAESDLFYWSGNNNQIYKVLLELQQEELVTFVVQMQTSLPAKKVYTITEKGRQALRESLLKAPEAPELHKSFLIQLACADSLSDDELLALLHHYETEVQAGLDLARGLAERAKEADGETRQRWMNQKIRENFVLVWQTELEWALSISEGLQKKQHQD